VKKKKRKRKDKVKRRKVISLSDKDKDKLLKSISKLYGKLRDKVNRKNIEELRFARDILKPLDKIFRKYDEALKSGRFTTSGVSHDICKVMNYLSAAFNCMERLLNNVSDDKFIRELLLLSKKKESYRKTYIPIGITRGPSKKKKKKKEKKIGTKRRKVGKKK